MPDYRLGRLNGEFVAVWYENNRRHRWRLGTSIAAEAKAALKIFARDRDRLSEPAERATVNDYWGAYVADRKAEGKPSVSRMQDAWKRLAPHFGGLRVADVQPDVVRSYTAQRRKHGASDGTIHTELGYLRAALRRALKGKAPDITLPSKPRPRDRHLTPDEARRLIDAAKMPHVRLFIMLALYTAARPSSILDLTWDRCDFQRRRIHFDDPNRDRTAKGRATVPMAEALVGPLTQASSGALTPYVIEWAERQVQSIKKGIERTAARAGLEDVTPYVLRHSAARWMVEGGVPIEEVAQYLGHTTPAVTFKVYGRYSPEYLRKASDVISTVLQGFDGPKPGSET